VVKPQQAKKSTKTSLTKSNSTSELNSISNDSKSDANDSVKYKYVVEKIKSKLNNNKNNNSNGTTSAAQLLTSISPSQLKIPPLPPAFTSTSAQNGAGVSASGCDLQTVKTTATSISTNATIVSISNSTGSTLSSLINSDNKQQQIETNNKLNKNDSQAVSVNKNKITNTTKLHNNKNTHKSMLIFSFYEISIQVDIKSH